MKKIKLLYNIDLYAEMSYNKIEQEVREFTQTKEKELIKAGVNEKFEVVVNVRMLNKSVSI